MKSKENKVIGVISAIVLVFVALICAVPFLIIISASLSQESEIMKFGYSLFPRGFSFDAYKMLFAAPGPLLKAYGVTTFTTIVGTALSMVGTVMMAYPLSRPTFRWRGFINLYMFLTMLLSGGAVASYLVICNVLHLRDNIMVLIWPGFVSAWNTILIRTFMTKDLSSYIEAAKIDGASEYMILFLIVTPLIKTGIAVILLKAMIGRWGKWYECLMYMPKEKYVTLQYYLQKILTSVKGVQEQAEAGLYVSTGDLPRETVRMAICVAATAPMLIAITPFQKYFVRGINLGGVKG